MTTDKMKKILPHILIIVIMLTGILAPFSVGITNNETIFKTEIRVNHTSAAITTLEAYDEYGKGTTSTSCGLFSGPEGCLLAVFMNSILEFFAWVLGGAGVLLDLAITETVLKMGENVENVGAVDSGWRMFRDVANIVIIFSLLAIGFATILRVSGYGMKELLAKVIIVALLINFSLFFTKVIIDSGNLLASQFYSQMTLAGCEPGSNKEILGKNACSISGQFMDALSLTSIYDTPDRNTTTAPSVDYDTIFTVGIMGSILFLTTTVVFLAGAFLLIIRFVALIFMMVLSPLAFAASILPATAGHAKRWWGALINYTLFAPIYFLLTSFVLDVVSSTTFRESIGVKKGVVFTDTLAGAGANISAFSIFLNFTIVIFLMVGALLISKQLGMAGSDAAIKASVSARKWGQGKVGDATLGGVGAVGRTLVGRGASWRAESGELKDKASRGGLSGAFNRLKLQSYKGLAKSSFDVRATKAGGGLGLGKAGGKGGYDKILDNQKKTRFKIAENIGKANETKGERAVKADAQKVINEINVDLTPIEDMLKKAQTAHTKDPTPYTLAELEKAQAAIKLHADKITTESGKITAIEKDVRERGEKRKAKYAHTLATDRPEIPGTNIPLWGVPRKNKEASTAIKLKKSPGDKLYEQFAKGVKENIEKENKDKESEGEGEEKKPKEE